ncbi:MAG: hypothetical protein UR42_C0028G0016 [Candidatus Roizmanbacteria bacterium GW2011_GWA2_33_33]|uniref:Uncharacterized protein n=2 Tax=Candidatus Roizmaniibacteriota TaxID=1752723 RepID=A0A0G0AV57_9BACT|nr:MAG: hypothetical protein UR42_C0028G0016 [Candidatus Roizmanbacteria bacterium GW2011_GWA2_33_33]KKP60919.1 MAG: hypothetical protein UR56_C0018G0018 [Candidatus Roizmanbacteria bacterium GW2011_GWC2_34_23]
MNLTELSYYFRKFLPYFILFCLIFLIFFYSVKLTLIYLESNKTNTIYTNEIFGKVSLPEIPGSSSSAGLKFTLDTIEGQPVTATDTAKVYFLPQYNPRFGYSEKIYLIAKSFGFNTEVVKHKLVGKTATFSDIEKTLTIDISNFNFKFDRKVNNTLFTSPQLTIPTKTVIENKAIDFLKKIGRYPDELAKGTTNVIYLKFNPINQNFVNVEKSSQAQLVEIDFGRPDVDTFKVVTPKFFTSQNYVIMLFQGEEFQIIKSQMAFFEKSEEQVGTYLVKTGEEAWSELNSGMGLVVAGTQGQKNILIKDMKLRYFDPDIYQNYLQPVYVFLGEGNFAAYVPAVKN